jgi:hypothetical protein
VFPTPLTLRSPARSRRRYIAQPSSIIDLLVLTQTPQAPAKLEHELPDAIHDTNSNKDTGKVSHATGPSKVPQAIQEGAPKKLEEMLPEKIHPTK